MMKLLEVDDNDFIDEDDNPEGRYICTIDPIRSLREGLSIIVVKSFS